MGRSTPSPHQRFLADVYNRVGQHTNHWPMAVADARDARPRIVVAVVVMNVDSVDLDQSVRDAEAFGREQSVTPDHTYVGNSSLQTTFFLKSFMLLLHLITFRLRLSLGKYHEFRYNRQLSFNCFSTFLWFIVTHNDVISETELCECHNLGTW